MSPATRTCYGLSALPQDVEHEIFQYIRRDKALLKTCTAVCKDWDKLLTPDLFHRFTLTPYNFKDPEGVVRQLAQASNRFKHSFTELVVDSFVTLSLNRLLALLATYFPNVHTVTLLSSYLWPAFDDRTFSLPRKLSLRKLAIRGGRLLNHALDPLVFLLGHFERIDTLTLVGERGLKSPSECTPFGLYFSSPWAALPAVKHLDISDMPVDMALLERMARQPHFAKKLVHLSLARSVVGCEQLAPVARVLRAAKDTLRRFRFFPTFRADQPVNRAGVHGAGMDLSNSNTIGPTVADALASCANLKEVRFSVLSSTRRVGTDLNAANVAGTFELHCFLIARVVQRGLPVTVDLTICLDHNGDARGFREAMAGLNWASLDKAAAGLVRSPVGRNSAPLTLWLVPEGVGERREQGQRVAEACFADWDWRRCLPTLTDPRDPMFVLRWEGV